MDHLFFNNWNALFRIAIVGIVSYTVLILLLRAAGKRTLSRMSAYDMVVTMALGSILAKVLLTSDQSISEGVAAMVVLIALQYALSVAMRELPWLRRIVSAKPAILFYQGQFHDENMRRERVDREEVQAAIHAKGVADNSAVEAVILNQNGDLSVVLKAEVLSQVVVTASRPAGEP